MKREDLTLNAAEPVTQAELYELGVYFIQPIYELIGGTIALVTLTAAAAAVFYGVRRLWLRIGL